MGELTFDRLIEGPSPVFFFKQKMKEENQFTDWLIELANRGFGLSTDTFLKVLRQGSKKYTN